MTSPAGTNADPEATWPPRFNNSTIGWIGIGAGALFLAIAGWFRDVFDSAGVFEGDDALQHVAAYVLFVVGLLMILGGVVFCFVEAKQPPPPPPPAPPGGGGGGGGGPAIVAGGPPATPSNVNPVQLVPGIANALKDQKRSTALLALGFVLLLLAAAGSGLIDISVSAGDGTTTTTTTSSTTTTTEIPAP